MSHGLANKKVALYIHYSTAVNVVFILSIYLMCLVPERNIHVYASCIYFVIVATILLRY